MAADDPFRDLWNRLRGLGRPSSPVILSPSLPVILSEAKNLGASLRINSAKDLTAHAR